MSKIYRLFISHSWSYSKNFDKVVKMIVDQGIRFYDHSVPKDKPIHTNGTDKELRAAIDAKIKGTSCVIILAGVYSSYSKWIKKEIEIAKSYGKFIIAIEPFGAEKTSKIVKDNADVIVKWQSKSIGDAVKKYG